MAHEAGRSTCGCNQLATPVPAGIDDLPDGFVGISKEIDVIDDDDALFRHTHLIYQGIDVPL
jgi:hypothetical protein